ncbi:nuclease-like isoform X2 [Montipora foliosa]|uniref:nuclease-like isoform X2 n=1 Tax=Montipora foliosa TaxID=591990 RepID=UPI0035F15267
MNAKMTSLHILTLVLFIFTILMANTQAKLIQQDTKINVIDELNNRDAEDIQIQDAVVSTTIQKSCKSFFAGQKPPSGFRKSTTNIRFICQQAPGNTVNFFYSTKFDQNYGIPIYSAYVVSQAEASQFGKAKRPSATWRREKGITKQANDATYKGTGYDKGHLVPAQTYSFTDEHMLSTFTYTNAVPQAAGFNRGQWAQYEKKIREYATNRCSPSGGNLYLITGISEVSLKNGKSGLEATQNTLDVLQPPGGDAISIPRSMWTAGCCISPSKGALGAIAVIGNNDKVTSNILMSQVQISTLQGFLLTGVKGFGGTAINLFPANPGCSNPGKWVNLLKRPASG